MKKEILISDLPLAVLEKERMSEGIHSDKWRILPYETSFCSGRLLCAGQSVTPPSLTLRLSAKGRYHVYLGMIQMRGAATSITLKLEGSDELYHINPISRFSWSSLETAVESYFKTLELDEEALILSKPADYLPHTSALAWIRLVPADSREPKTAEVAYHLDSDYFADDLYPTARSVTGRIESLRDGGAGLILQETFASCEGEKYDPDPTLFPRAAAYKHFHKEKSAIEGELIKKAHSIGAKIYAAYRIEATQFAPPNDFSGINLLFPDSYDGLEGLECVSRDGRRLAMHSFSYPEVRKRVIKHISNIMNEDYDGISLVFCRGTFVAFEQPICEQVYRRFGVDARKLPMSDARYYTVACSFVTEFMRELRRELDASSTEHRGINTVVFFTPEDSRNFGLDTETWINEGLVDSVSQGLMRVFEDLDGTLAEDGLVDLQKYKEALLERPTVKREFRITDKTLDLIVKGAKDFMKLCNGKADFYATLLWEAQTEEETVSIVDRLKSMGVNSFISWNANHKAKILSRINAEKFYAAGSAAEYEKKRSRYYRVLSIGGADISQFDPNWKG